MVDSQVRATLIKLGADVRADFHTMLAGWRGDWLSPASVSQSHWLATDRLAAALGQVQEPFDSLLDLQRFLTAGFLPGADPPREEPVPTAGGDRAGAASVSMAAARAAGAAQFAPPAAVDQATRPVPAHPDTQRSVSAAAVHPFPAAPPQSPTTGQTAAPLAGAAAPGQQPVVAAPLGTRQRSGPQGPAQQGSPSTAPLAEAAEADDSGEPSFWAAPPRVGGLRDLAQRLSTNARPPTAWAEPAAASTHDLWPAPASNVSMQPMAPNRPMLPVEEAPTAARAAGAAQFAPPAAVDQATRPVPAHPDTQRSVSAAAVHPFPAAPPQSPTTGQTAAPLAGAAAPGQQPVVAAPLGTRQRSGPQGPAQQGSPSTAPLAEAAEADDSGEPSFWAAPPRVGGLRDLAQRLSTNARPPTAWAEPAAASTHDLWPAPASNVSMQPMAPNRPMQPVEEPPTVASGGGAVLPTEGATSLTAGSGREGTAAALSPVALPASTAPAAYAPHGQSGQAAAPNAAIPPVYTTHPQVDDLMDALAREITREYHRYYGA